MGARSTASAPRARSTFTLSVPLALLTLFAQSGRAQADAPVDDAGAPAAAADGDQARDQHPAQDADAGPLADPSQEPAQQDQDERREGPATRPPPPHRHAIFVYPYAILRRGVVLGYEYAAPRSRLGLLAEYSFERRARGDFRSTASGLGLGWRVYLLGRSRFGSFDGPACVGLFLGGMGSLRVVGVREANGRRVVGRATRATAEGQLGFRFPIRGKAEISAMGTVGFHTDFVGGLALQLRPSVGVALTVGVLL